MVFPLYKDIHCAGLFCEIYSPKKHQSKKSIKVKRKKKKEREAMGLRDQLLWCSPPMRPPLWFTLVSAPMFPCHGSLPGPSTQSITLSPASCFIPRTFSSRHIIHPFVQLSFLPKGMLHDYGDFVLFHCWSGIRQWLANLALVKLFTSLSFLHRVID